MCQTRIRAIHQEVEADRLTNLELIVAIKSEVVIVPGKRERADKQHRTRYVPRTRHLGLAFLHKLIMGICGQ